MSTNKMGFFKNRTISKKIWSIVIIATIIFSLVSITSFVFLQSTQKKLSDALHTRTYNLNLLRASGVDLYQIHATQQQLYLLDPSSEEFKNQLAFAEKNYKQLNGRILEYEKTTSDPTEIGMINDFKTKFQSFTSESQQILELAKSSNNKEREIGKDILANTIFKSFLAAEESLDLIGDVYIENGENLAEAQKKVNNYITVFLVILLIIGLSVIYVISYITTKNISVNVKKITDILNKVGEGELTERIKIDSEDELKYISVATNKMIDSIYKLVKIVVEKKN